MMNNARYSIFDTMIEGVQIINRHWQYVYVNDALVQYSLYPREELLERTMMERYPGIETTKMFSHLRACMENGTPHTMINEFTFPDGSRGYFELRIHAIPDGVMILSNDISERHTMAIMLKELNENLEKKVAERTSELIESLERQKKMNEITSTLVTVASHELRTPLSAILTSAALAERYSQPEQTEQRQKHLGKIKSAVVHLTAILNDFLSMDKLETGRMEYTLTTISVHEYVKEILDDLQLITRNGQEIHHYHSGTLQEIQVDKNVIRNVIINLVSNAIKYSPNGGSIDIETEVTEKDLCLVIRDKGIGIPEAEREHVFEKFFKASNTGSIQGAGLGLAIVKKYIDLVKGTISFNSQVNKGTTFMITIPHSK